MIKITGSIKRSFIFPAIATDAMAYYCQIERIIQFLPHISLVHKYSEDQLRVLYQSQELGTYTIRIYSDLGCELDHSEKAISVFPIKLPEAPEIPTTATMRETSGHGLFAIDAKFFALGEKTRVEYIIRMQGELERPAGMKLMPRRVVNKIARSITENRIREIADGFIQQSVTAYEKNPVQ